MVVVGEFKLELVDDETKNPFKEHHKDGQTYVEVEPEVEYKVSLQRIAFYTNTYFIIACKVDGKCLGWVDDFPIESYKEGPRYLGSINRINCETLQLNSLKFARPKLVGNSAECPYGPMLMGKVEFEVYERGNPIRPNRSYSSTSEMARSLEPTIPGNTAHAMKQVRSTIGTKSNIVTVDARQQWEYGPGALLWTVTLNYCTVPGLINSGILPKPPNMYEYHRMMANKNKDKPIPPLLVQPQRICEEIVTSSNGTNISREPKYYDLFDLTELDDASEDSGNGTVATTANASSEPKTVYSSSQARRPSQVTPDYISSNKKPRFT